MASSTQDWNSRYRDASYSAGTEPAPFLREVLPLLPRGRALDLAMGAGRNAVFLAANGWRVTGVDSSRAALEKAEALARERKLRVRWASAPRQEFSLQRPGLLLVEADLESYVLPTAKFELVVCFYYLQRSLFSAIGRALAPEGVLVYETYTVEQLAFSHGARNPQHLLGPNELRECCPDLATLFYRELRAGKGIASLVARKP